MIRHITSIPAEEWGMSRRLCNLQSLFVKLRARYGDGDDVVEEVRRELRSEEERETQSMALQAQQPPPLAARTQSSDGRAGPLL